jgi:hypothetical protein
LYSSGLCKYIAAASPLRGSIGFGYVNNWGRNDSKMLERSKRENRKLITQVHKIHVESMYQTVSAFAQ